MIDDETNSKLEQLTQLIAPGAKLVRSWPLNGGISSTMTGFEIEKPGGALKKLIARVPGSWALERNPDIGAIEFRLLEQLTKQGLAVPEPVYLDAERAVFDVLSLVTGYVEGAPEFDPQDMPLYVERSARQLLEIHKMGFSNLKDVPDAWETTTARIHWAPDEPDHPQRDLEIRALLKEIQPRITAGPSVFLHGDFWPGNSIWQDGHIVCVIDWEEPHIGDALFDISITRSELLFAFGHEVMEAFTKSYADLSGVDLTNLPFWDLCAALRPMGNFAAWAGSWPPLGRDDITEATMRAAHLEFVDAAKAKIER